MDKLGDLGVRLSRLPRFFPYILTTCIFVLTIWSIWFQVQIPSASFSFTLSNGDVTSVDGNILSTNKIKAGDQIIRIDGIALDKILIFPGKNEGEYQNLLLKRNGKIISADVLLQKPTFIELYERLSPVFIGLLFLILGILVYSFLQPNISSIIFYIFCQGLCLMLVAGAVSTFGLPIARDSFGVMLWWIGPLTFHSHLQLVAPAKSKHAATRLPIVYGLALLFSIIYLWSCAVPLISVKEILFYLAYIWLVVNLCLLFTILFITFRRAQSFDIRRKIGIIFFSFICGIGPFLLFSLFPELIFSKTILPYEISLSFLLFMPVGYGLAIFRYRLLTLDRYVNRTATKSLLVLIIVSLYGFIYLAAPQLVPIKMSEVLLSGFVVIFILIFTYQPLSLFLQRFVDRILYGGWYDDKEIIWNVNLTLHESQANPNEIVNSLCQALQKTLQLEYVNFLFPNGNLFTTYDMGNLTCLGQQTLRDDRVISIFSRLSQLSEYGFGDARLLNKGTATDKQIFGDHPQLWLLLKNQTDNLGLLVLGDRRGGEFEQLDLNTLAVVTRQASYALENATLLAQVSQQTRKVQALNNQMAEAREEERKRLARELHDQILQSLYGLNFHIFKIKPHLSSDYQSEIDLIHDEIQGTADHVRAICSDLRPPALDSQGLIPATRDYVRNLKKVTGLQITFSSDGDETQALPSTVSITLYRILQECLANVQKHACANNVLVHLSVEKSRLSMTVSDDGKGFFLPKNFEQFTKSEHYGLAGIQERLNSVGGQLDIISSPDQGCEVRVKVPFQLPFNEVAFLQENNNDYSGDYRR